MSKEEVLELIRKQKGFLEKKYNVKKIGVFGSYAKDTMTDDSDIDIIIDLDKPDLFMLISIKQLLETVLNNKVDIVRNKENMNKLLKDRIDKDVIYV